MRLVAKVGGGSYFRIKQADLDDLGQDGLVHEIQSRGVGAADLGEPKYDRHRRVWTIAVRKDADE